MKYIDLMIDTETMGLPPDGALLSIGAVFFDLQTEQFGPPFSRTISLATAVRDGGTLTPSTIMWWLGQSQEARDAVRFSGGDIRVVLAELADYIAEHSRVQDVRPWGNSSSFDMTLINSAYIRSGIPTPWHFTNERCFRTVRNMYPQVEYNIEKKGKGAHNALADAVFQAEHLIAIKNRNKK
jgi:DNA polymerase III epsilon subunit-like protein